MRDARQHFEIKSNVVYRGEHLHEMGPLSKKAKILKKLKFSRSTQKNHVFLTFLGDQWIFEIS